MIEFTKGYEEHDRLNPKLWDGIQLRPEVKVKLLQIAEKFREENQQRCYPPPAK
jgi:hypothetical protein